MGKAHAPDGQPPNNRKSALLQIDLWRACHDSVRWPQRVRNEAVPEV